MYCKGFCACDKLDLFRLQLFQQCCTCCSADSCLGTRSANICKSFFETAAVSGSIACHDALLLSLALLYCDKCGKRFDWCVRIAAIHALQWQYTATFVRSFYTGKHTPVGMHSL